MCRIKVQPDIEEADREVTVLEQRKDVAKSEAKELDQQVERARTRIALHKISVSMIFSLVSRAGGFISRLIRATGNTTAAFVSSLVQQSIHMVASMYRAATAAFLQANPIVGGALLALAAAETANQVSMIVESGAAYQRAERAAQEMAGGVPF